jgi:hypothetical protein
LLLTEVNRGIAAALRQNARGAPAATFHSKSRTVREILRRLLNELT